MFEYTVLTIGQFSRNVFWGESESRAYRPAICTSTLVRRGGDVLVVDPALPPEQMAEALYNHTGLRPDAVTAVFITHAHGDHYVGVDCFPNAQWYMGGLELERMAGGGERERLFAAKFRAADSGFIKGLDILDLPGHTPGTAAVLFDSADGKVAVCGDAVMTRDFFNARKGYYNSMDFAQATLSIEKLGSAADIVVPGHDNYFITRR